MELHCIPNDVGNLVELTVIHFHHRVQNSSLNRLQPVFNIGNRTVLNDVGSIFKEVFVQQGFDVFHLDDSVFIAG